MPIYKCQYDSKSPVEIFHRTEQPITRNVRGQDEIGLAISGPEKPHTKVVEIIQKLAFIRC